MSKKKNTTLLDIHNFLIKNNYELSLSGFEYYEVGEQLELLYYPYGNMGDPYSISIIVNPSISIMKYILCKNVIDDEFFNLLTFFEYRIQNTPFNYNLIIDGNSYYIDEDEDNNIISRNINSFFKLYNISNNFIIHITEIYTNFVRETQSFLNKHHNFLESRGWLYKDIKSIKNMPLLELQNITSYEENVTFIYDVYTEKVTLLYGCMDNQIVYDISKITKVQLNKAFPLVKQDSISSTLIKAYLNNQIELKHIKYAYNVLSSIEYDIHNTYSNIDNIKADLECMYYEFFPQNVKIRKLIHKAIQFVRNNSIEYKHFNINHPYFKL